MLFWAGGVWVLGYALWRFHATTKLTFSADCLLLERRLFLYKDRCSVWKREIERLRQVKDGGEGEDDFPSWGLSLDAARTVRVLSRQEIEKSAWLGPIVAQWAGVEYRKWEEKGSCGTTSRRK